MYRFDSRYGQYWYPESQENSKSTPFITGFELLQGINGGSQSVRFRESEQKVVLEKVGFPIPTGASTYEEYSSLMQDNENQFAKSIVSLQS